MGRLRKNVPTPVRGRVVPRDALKPQEAASRGSEVSVRGFAPKHPPVSRRKVHEEPPMRGNSPEQWTDRLPRYPHPSEMEFTMPTETIGRHDPVPIVCVCNDTNSMIALQNQTITRKPGDYIECWCTLCWRAPRIPYDVFKKAYKQFVKLGNQSSEKPQEEPKEGLQKRRKGGYTKGGK